MPPKPDSQPPVKKTTTLICGATNPGPKYQLRTLVGYQKHCLSRYRNPAYTFGHRHPLSGACSSPGPKYLVLDPKRGGFTFGLRLKHLEPFCGPGPKYILPTEKGPAFSIKFRTKYRGGCSTPGPHNVVLPRDSPAFSMGIRTTSMRCDHGPAPRLYSVDLVKPRSPMFSLAARIPIRSSCDGPGPKYHPKLPKPRPMYSFGVKHSECAPPYILECDEPC